MCRIALILAAGLLASCGRADRDVLTKEEMAYVLTAAYLAEAQGLATDSAGALRAYAEHLSGQKIEASDSLLRRSLARYMSRPEELEAALSIVIDTLSMRKERLKIVEKNLETAR